MSRQLIQRDIQAMGHTSALALLTGEHINQGCSRDVYALEGYYHMYGLNKKLFGDEWNRAHECVLKLAKDDAEQNWLEYNTWDRVQYTEFAKWFAPIHSISCDGFALIQIKCEPLGEPPDKIPAFFTDVSPRNWGRINGNPVCLDYGITLLPEQGMTKRMKKWDGL